MFQPNIFPSSVASAADSVSHHSFAGRTTAPSASKHTMPCCCPLTPTHAMASGVALASASAFFTATRTPSSHVAGSCSAAFAEAFGRRPYDFAPRPATARASRS